MKGPSLSEQLDVHLENRERLDFGKEVEREARADVLREVREAVEQIPVGYTVPRTAVAFRFDVLAALNKLNV